jgi:hypothetical protein
MAQILPSDAAAAVLHVVANKTGHLGGTLTLVRWDVYRCGDDFLVMPKENAWGLRPYAVSADLSLVRRWKPMLSAKWHDQFEVLEYFVESGEWSISTILSDVVA